MIQTSGNYATVHGDPVVTFERTFPHPADAVWAAITDSQQLEKWFPTTVEFETLAPGSPITFEFTQDHDNQYPSMSGEFLEVEPQRRLVFTWGDDKLTFELDPQQSGAACRLSFSVVLDSQDKAARDSAGWESCLDMLALTAAGETPPRPMPSDDWRTYYEEYKRQGLPATAPLPD
jgi:uncharacterized protein YndB with AHSA1/START domain